MAEAELQKQSKSICSKYLYDREEIARVMRVWRDQRAEVQVRFDDDTKPCTAKILDVLETTLLLDDVRPRCSLPDLRSEKPFSLAARVHGMYAYSAKNYVHKADAERCVPYFHIALPENLLYQQRRKSARFRVPLKVTADGAWLSLKRGHHKPMRGKVVDISAGGCRVEFTVPPNPPIEIDNEVACEISIPNILDLNSVAVIRHLAYDKQNKSLVCGIELTQMNVTDRRRLEQFIQLIAKIGTL